MSEERRDGFEPHAPVDRLGRQRVTELVRMHVADTGALGDSLDVTVDGAPVEGLMVVAFDEQTSRCRSPPGSKAKRTR